ncbi:MAG: methyltransferase family protein [Paracoccus sp. (in: a-proteobacteria)]
MRNWPLTADYPPLWTLGFAIAIWIAGRILPSGADLLVLVGWLMVLAALALMLWAVGHFRRAQTTVNPHGQPSALVTGGPFRFSRNPIYLGDALLLAGLCLALRALPALILIPLFVRIVNRRFIAPEEARLAAAFPRDYPDYARRTRRWL